VTSFIFGFTFLSRISQCINIELQTYQCAIDLPNIDLKLKAVIILDRGFHYDIFKLEKNDTMIDVY